MKKFLGVIDMLNDFVHPEGKLFCGPAAEGIVKNVAERVKTYINTGDSYTVFINDAHEEDDLEFKLFPKHAVNGTDGAKVIKELQPFLKSSFTISKQRYSAFYNTSLDNFLKANFIYPDNSIIELCGVCTSICLLFSAADFVNRGFKVVIHEKCIADFNTTAHVFTLNHMKKVLGIEIL